MNPEIFNTQDTLNIEFLNFNKATFKYELNFEKELKKAHIIIKRIEPKISYQFSNISIQPVHR